MIVVEARTLGARDREPQTFHVPPPPTSDPGEGDPGWSVRDLVAAVVREEVRAERARRARAQRPGALSADELAAGITRGKVAPRERRGVGRLDEETEVRRAFDAFDRGEVLLVVEGRRAEHLDEPVSVQSAAPAQFLRLVPLWTL